MPEYSEQSPITATPQHHALRHLRLRPTEMLAGANHGIKFDNTLHVPPAFYSLAVTSRSEEELRLLMDSLFYVELDR